jgi:hypothetical protein
MGKKFAKLKGYGELCIPVKLLERVLEEGYIVSTRWDQRSYIDKVSRIDEVNIVDEDEIKAALAQQILEGNQ